MSIERLLPWTLVVRNEKDIIMRVDPRIAEVFVELDPSYATALNKNGNFVIKLEKALYGCIESSKLWSDNLSD